MVPYTNLMTVWKPGDRDEITGIYTWGAPAVFKAVWRKGGGTKLVDNSGREFMPQSVFWTRLEVVSGLSEIPGNGWKISKGDQSAVADPTTIGAETIRMSVEEDNSLLGFPPDYQYGTE